MRAKTTYRTTGGTGVGRTGVCDCATGGSVTRNSVGSGTVDALDDVNFSLARPESVSAVIVFQDKVKVLLTKYRLQGASKRARHHKCCLACGQCRR